MLFCTHHSLAITRERSGLASKHIPDSTDIEHVYVIDCTLYRDCDYILHAARKSHQDFNVPKTGGNLSVLCILDLADRMVSTTRRISQEVDGRDNQFSDAKGLMVIVACSFYTILLFVLASLITTILSYFYKMVIPKVSQLTLSDDRSEMVEDLDQNVKNTLLPSRTTKNG